MADRFRIVTDSFGAYVGKSPSRSVLPKWVLLAVLLMVARSGAAQNVPQTTPLPSAGGTPADTANVEAERRLIPQSYGITGLVVDETRTTIGRDFYAIFYDAWQAPEGSVNYTVVVEEQPVPSLGTRVIVHVNDEVAFDARLQPRYEMIREAALAAVAYARRTLAASAPLSRGI